MSNNSTFKMQTIDLPDFAVSYEVLLGSVIFEAPSCLQYTNFLELNGVLGGRHWNGLYIEETQPIPRSGYIACRKAPVWQSGPTKISSRIWTIGCSLTRFG